MKTKEQRNLIQDIFPPQINRPLRQVQGKPAIRRSKDSYMNFQTGFQCISISLIGLLIFMPLSPVFAEEITESSKEVSDIDIISQTTAVEDEAPILSKTDTVEEKLASTIKESSVNEPVEESVENEMEEIAEERVVETGAEEIINSITESVIENSEAAENTDVIAESESETATSSAAINSEAVKSLQEENDDKAAIVTSTEEILISNAGISSSSPEIIEDSADAANVVSPADVSDLSSAAVTAGQAILPQTGLAQALSTDSTSSPQASSVQIEPQLAPKLLNDQDPFAGKECIFLNNGDDFYCFKSNKESNASTSVEILGTVEKGKVSSIRDSDGDREISLYINGKSVQITNNNRDDLFPAQDISGSSIVWQSLINDRWQIMFYDQETATTTQITDSDFNNMTPQIYGDVIVWQGWPRDNWEIFYAKKNTNGEWIVKQVTNNDYPDMFPKVMGNSIVWQALSSEGGSASGEKDGSWHIFTYDIKSDAITKISSTGIKNENPEFMIVWEEKGDGTAARTFGYNLSNGGIVELNNNNDAPKEIPEPPLRDGAALLVSTTTPNKLENEESN